MFKGLRSVFKESFNPILAVLCNANYVMFERFAKKLSILLYCYKTEHISMIHIC